MAGSEIIEGVFAINKPSSLSSAEVLRRLQDHFLPSRLFSPLLAREANNRSTGPRFRKRKRHDQNLRVKLGHGGTLDPLATGVLICGVGSGTKSLSRFLECTKSYETVVLFGAATDTYDVLGKQVALAPYKHITKDKIEEALGNFRGKILQKPPIFSALRMDGKRLYEYAREGLAPPKEIEERPVEVIELELVEWMEGGSHTFQWPKELAGTPVRELAEKLMDNVGQEEPSHAEAEAKQQAEMDTTQSGVKHNLDDIDSDREPLESLSPVKKIKVQAADISEALPIMSGALPPEEVVDVLPEDTEPVSKPTSTPPAARLRMTVTSGFYVRSLCHDLGVAVGSLGLMATLVRTRQGDFILGENVLEYDDLNKGEETWGTKVEKMLKEWTQKTAGQSEDEERRAMPKKNGFNGPGRAGQDERPRRNSSSIEP